MHTHSLYADLKKALLERQQEDNHRFLTTITAKQGPYVTIRGKSYINLSSNDYLGLGADATLLEEFLDTMPVDEKWLTSASSRLLTGNHKVYARLEETLCDFYLGKAALVFNTGYQTNLGVLSALLGKGDVIFSDKLNHASIIDGIKLSGATCFRYPHRNYPMLEKLLDENRKDYRHAVIVTEAVFSMEGDRADLPELVRLKQAYRALLYVDEAHSVGVLGGQGRGLAAEQQVLNDVDILIGTCGKALASLGAFVICEPLLKDYLINTMRPFIFTTALPPINVSWTRFVLQKSTLLEEKQTYLNALTHQFRSALADKEIKTCGDTHIIPLIIGENAQTRASAERIRAGGYLLFPIKPPTVPKGTARLRVSLTASLEWAEIERLLVYL